MALYTAKTVIHTFPRVVKRTNRPVSWGDVTLVPTNGVSHGIVQNKLVSSYHVAEFDIFMISYHEAEADENFQKLRNRFKDAQHVKNVEGIGNAHKKVGDLAKSEMVYVVDADADYQPISDVSNITRFNKDPYRTWRSAFRECVKLASSVNPNQRQIETDARLETWCTVDNGARFGRYCLKGALEGKAYGIEHKDSVENLNKINDYEWLREQFVASMKKKVKE